MKLILYIVLGIYTVGMGTYALSEIYIVYGCVRCFKEENAFPGSTGSGGGTRAVNVRYDESGSMAFTGAGVPRITNALNTAMQRWNTATDGTNTTPFRFQSAQHSPQNMNLRVVLVGQLEGRTSRNACMQLQTFRDPNGAISRGILYIRRDVFNRLSEEELAQLIEHEFGHFMGLDDHYGNPEQCDTVMNQAREDCRGLRGERPGISRNDVATINRYVADSSRCW